MRRVDFDILAGVKIPQRAQAVIELRLNSGWSFLSIAIDPTGMWFIYFVRGE